MLEVISIPDEFDPFSGGQNDDRGGGGGFDEENYETEDESEADYGRVTYSQCPNEQSKRTFSFLSEFARQNRADDTPGSAPDPVGDSLVSRKRKDVRVLSNGKRLKNPCTKRK